MTIRSYAPRLLALAALLLTGGCERDTSLLEPAPFPSTAVIFDDGFAPAMGFEAFSGAKTDALSVDATVRRTGNASLRVRIPAPNDPTGSYAGGAFVDQIGRDLSGYNALTFWVRASNSAKLNVAGLGNDNTGTSRFTAQRTLIDVTPAWTKVILPIPDASKLTREKGLLFFAEGAENGAGYDLWLDDIQFETLPDLGVAAPRMPSQSITQEVGGTVAITGATATWTVGGVPQTMEVAPGYFTFTSSNAAVATVNEAGTLTTVGPGTATISARLGGVAATGAITVRAVAAPAVAAPTPTRAAADVISLFSDAYPNVPVTTWSASFDQADVADVRVAGNNTKKYTNLVFAAAEFLNPTVNATAMTHLHLDLFVYDAASFKVKLVDFGANNAFGGGDDTEHEIEVTPTSTPALVANAWNSFDIPLTAFAGLRARANLAQLILVGSSPTVYLDNIYFYRVPAPPAPTAPTTAAPTPTRAASNVIALFSNAYPNRPVDTWSADWDQADVADIRVANDDVKRYTNLTFAGVEFTSQPVNAAPMSGLHLDLWTPDATAAPAEFKVKLVDFGANGTFGGGDDVEHELSITRAAFTNFATGTWVSLDLPFTSFPGLTTRAHLAQLIISGSLRTVYLDNVYFYSTAAPPTVPTAPAPAPTFAAANVISLFSNAYTNAPVDTWSADWDQADLADIKVGTDDVKRYTNLVFAGIEFTGRPIDATAMTTFSMDLWTPYATAAPAVFRIKLVDFGANGAFAGGDDTEHEITLTATTTPALGTGAWVRLSIPLSAFTGLRARAHLGQLIISGDLKTVFIDNVLFHR
jgi:hypothetical protein